MASSSSAMVVSDAQVIWEERRGEESKVHLCSKQLIFHEGTMNLRDHLLKVHPLHYKKNESEAVSSDEFLRP